MALPSELLKTPLAAQHRQLGARMVDFAGWDMPVQYPTGILAEHDAVRSRCGLFDLSHMGRVHVVGADAMALSQECCTRDLARIPQGEAAYGLLCTDDGGILDDVIAYRLADAEVMFVFNASNRVADTDFFVRTRDRLGCQAEVVDHTLDTALIGIQGPAAEQVLGPLADRGLADMAGYAFARADVCGAPALVSRTGYTGEDGFEVMVDAEQAERVWNVLLRAATPCGLGARDTLRTEAGFALYGHELDLSTTPFEARLGWVVSLGKSSFVGREALIRLKAEGPRRRLAGLRVAPGGVPRPELPILDNAGQRVGKVTSGTFSPTLKANIAMGYVPVGLSQVGEPLQIELRGKPVAAEIVGLPFVPHRSRPRAKM
jgi:aminomethyltransferase